MLVVSFSAKPPTPSQKRVIKDYFAIGKVRDPKGFYDVTQRPASGCGSECRGTDPLFTFTAHTSKVWSAEGQRFLDPREPLLGQGFVAFHDIGDALSVPVLPLLSTT